MPTERDARNLDPLDFGQTLFVDATNGDDGNSGRGAQVAFATIQAAHDAADANTVILIAPGDYDEALVITKDNLIFRGAGPRGSVSIAPSAVDAVAVTIDGTTASGRVEEVHLENVGGEGNGTGGGLHVKGNIRRPRIQGCKFEGGAFGAKLESTAAGSVGDVIFRDCEFAWTTTGVAILSSGGGDPVTQVQFDACLWHNCATDGLKSTVTAPANLWLNACRFDDDEAGTAPTGTYVDADEAGTSGLLSGCYFPVAINGGKVLLAATIVAVGCLFLGGVNTAQPT